VELLHQIEQTGLSVWIREGDSVWAYPTVITLHSIGLAVMVGLSAVIALRILGVAPGLPLSALNKLYPTMWVGFWVNAFSGVGLIVADPVTMLTNPLMSVKLLLIAAAVTTLVLIRRRVLCSPAAQAGGAPSNGRGLAFASLALWTAATTVGRLTAYLGAQLPL
jgi:hypothetical protein